MTALSQDEITMINRAVPYCGYHIKQVQYYLSVIAKKNNVKTVDEAWQIVFDIFSKTDPATYFLGDKPELTAILADAENKEKKAALFIDFLHKNVGTEIDRLKAQKKSQQTIN